VSYLELVTPEAPNIATRYVERRVFLLSMLLLGLLFAVTAALSGAYHARQEELVEEWSRRGNADLAAGNPGSAFEDFRNSLSYGPENEFVQLRLAEALLADGRYTEARSYLLNLWEKTPGSGQVSLDLAHDSLHLGNVNEAIHYFRAAILGSWDKEPAVNRRNVRLELCDLLLSLGRDGDAQAEIAGLAVDTPTGNAFQREETGRFFLRAADPEQALAEFEAALHIDPRQTKWLAEAGQAAFQAGDYSKAEKYFSKAEREDPSDELHQSLELARAVLGNDPFYPGLSETEIERRISRDLEQSLVQLRACIGRGSSVSQSTPALLGLAKDAQAFQKQLNRQSLEKNPEERNEAMQLVLKIADTVSQTCGPAGGLDRALMLIEKQHEGKAP